MAEPPYTVAQGKADIEARIADKEPLHGRPLVVEGRVTFVKSRWTVGAKIEPRGGGEPLYLVASADSADTSGDGIWLGRLEEWVDRRNE